MTLQQVLSQVRRAADDYEMIQDGDKIAVGISGGKDSLTLLYALSTLRRFYPHPFELHAVTVDLGFENLNLGKIEALCKELDVPYTIVPTQIASIVFDQRKEKNPCALCAKMRKGALNEAIRGAGCNKIAYAHHKDDVVETLMLSLIYEGRFHTFAPVTFLDRMNLTVIRPLVYMKEADVIGFSGCQKSLPCRRTYSQRICQAAAASAEPGKSGGEGSDVHCGSEWSCGMEGT